MPFRSLAKFSLQHVAAQLGPQRIKLGSKCLVILMYHRVLPAQDERMQDEEPGMVVTPETFALHLRILQQHFDIMHLAEWLQRREQGLTLPQRACAITFDDGWLDNYQFAFPLLKQSQVPATIFLVSDMVSTQRNFWPERLAKLLRVTARHHSDLWEAPAYRWLRELHTGFDFGQTPPNHEQLFTIFDQAKRLPDEEIHAHIDAMHTSSKSLPTPAAAVVSWDQVAEMTGSGLVDFGSHTCDHIRLTDNISLKKTEHQIVASRARIEEAANRSVELFCFPNGDFSDAALSITRQHYTGAVTTARGWNSKESDAHLLNRIGVHEDISADKTAFLARLSGWL